MAVEAKKVKELRERTDLPMMECKRALEKADGDVDKAYDQLRKAGLKAKEKLAGRTSLQGKVASRLSNDGKQGVIVALRCETESVAKNEKFQEFLEELAQLVENETPADTAALTHLKTESGETVEQGVTDLINQIRENINLGRFARFNGDAVVQYVHFDNKKAAMVALEGGSASDDAVQELGKGLCMHIVFEKPKALSREQVDPESIEKEREIRLAAMKNDPKNAKKPEEILAKIISGQMDKWVAQECLLEQPFVRDQKQTVQQVIDNSGTGVKILDFAYVATDIE